MIPGPLVFKTYVLEPPHTLPHHPTEEYFTMEEGEFHPRSMRSPGPSLGEVFDRHCAGYAFWNGRWRGGWAPVRCGKLAAGDLQWKCSEPPETIFGSGT